VGPIVLSEEKKDESWFSALSMLSKINPVVLILGFALMNVFAYIYRSQMQFHFKVFALTLSFFFLFLAVSFEFQRLEKERELKEKGLA